MSDEIPITEADLHAYIDNQLSSERHKRVGEWLKTHPHEAARLQRYQEISDQLHERFDPVMEQVMPDHLQELVSKFNRPKRRVHLFKTAVSACLVLLGVSVGWNIKPVTIDAASQPLLVHLAKPAAFAHTVYATDKLYPVEINASEQERLISWLSDRLRTKIQAPNLAVVGFRLLGGRLIPSTNRMAAQFMYQNVQGKRITLYVRRVSSYKYNKTKNNLKQAKEFGVQIFYWRKGDLGFAITGDLKQKSLKGVVKVTQSQISI